MKINPEKIVNFMIKNCLSVNELSKLTKIHRNTLNKILKGEKVTLKPIIKLANLLKLDYRDLFE